MIKDYDPTIKAATKSKQTAYWEKREAELAAAAPPGEGGYSSKTYPLRQARKELKKLKGEK